MKQFKSLKIVIPILVLLLILVIARNSNPNIFKGDVKTAIEAAQNNGNLRSPGQVGELKSPWLLVNLGTSELPDSLRPENSISLPFENLLDRAKRKILEDFEGELVLYAADAATAAQAWVILNQLGFKKVYILNTGGNPEELKYKFQPDTTVRLEQD